MKFKNFKVVTLLLVVIILLVGCQSNSDPKTPADTPDSPEVKETIVVKMGHTGNEASMMHQGYEVIKEYMETESEGVFKVEIFAGGQLGNDPAHVEAVQRGDLQIIGINNAYLTAFNPKSTVFAMPFVFKNQDIAYCVLEGEWGQQMLDSMSEVGLKGLSYIDSFAYRQLTSNKPVYSPDDLKGVKIRVMPNPIHIKIWESLGANPAAISFSELYTALQQNTVDAQENPFENIVSARLYEVQKYITLTNHVYTTGMILTNPDWFDALSPDLQKIVSDAAYEAYEYQKVKGKESMDEYIKTCTDAGVEIIELSNEELGEFEMESKPAIDMIVEAVGQDLVDSLYEAVKACE